MCADPEPLPDVEGLQRALREPLRKVFVGALLGRLIVVPYFPISDTTLDLITRLGLRKIAKRLADNRGIEFTYTEDVVDLVKSRCTEVESGARAVDAIFTHTLLPAISETYLEQLVQGTPVTTVNMEGKDDDFSYLFGG
jgi:type VI secretion system protein VasG